jgi:hypothetical protein
MAAAYQANAESTRVARSRNSPDQAAQYWCDATRSTFAYRRVALTAANSGYVSTNLPTWTCYYTNTAGGTESASTVQVGQYAASHPMGPPWDACTTPPPPPEGDDCSDMSGTTVNWPIITAADEVPSDTYCFGGCESYKTPTQRWHLGFDQGNGKRFWNVDYKFTGMLCDTEVAPPAPTQQTLPDPGPRCTTNANGEQWCREQGTGENCGYLNGKYSCVDQLEPDKCWVMQDGSRLCADNAPMPPVPDSGTPGDRATEDGNVVQVDNSTDTQENTYNYYDSDTVNNSSAPPGNDGDPGAGSGPGPAGGGSGGTGTDPTSDDSAGGGGDCSAPPTCSGDPIACAQLQQQWKARCPDIGTEAQLRAGITDTGVGADGKFPAGTTVTLGEEDFDAGGFVSGRACPVPASFDLGSLGSIGFDASGACDVLSVMAAIILAGGWLMAARIAFGA